MIFKKSAQGGSVFGGKKYIILIKNAWQRQLVYRSTVYAYRLGNVVEILFQFAIWTSVYQSTTSVFGYNYHEMITYVLIGWLINFLTDNYGMADVVAKDIQNGTLSNYLLKPLSYLKYTVTMSLGRITIALFSGVVMQLFFIIFFYKELVMPPSWLTMGVIVVIVVLGYFVRLFISVLFGLVAFWTTDVSGLNSFFSILIRFLSGGYAPLNLLPQVLYRASLFFPFAYIVFFPTQLYLGKVTLQVGLRGIGIELLWLIALYGLIKLVWLRGLKKYEGVGI
jgi:ABC-2 type transport system permease protein